MTSPAAAAGLVLALLTAAASLLPGDCRFIVDPLTFIKQDPPTPEVCSECRAIVQLSANMISSRDMKMTVYATLHTLCQQFPSEQASECDLRVKMYLPEILQQTQGPLNPDKTCSVFGLCAVDKKEVSELPHRAADKDKSSSAFGADVSGPELFNPVCSLCMLIVKKLETLLPQNVTEDALKTLLEEVCDLIPHSYKNECDDFISKYEEEIVEFLMSSAAPLAVCGLLHVCSFQEQPQPEVVIPSDCDSCRTLAVLSRLYVGLNATEHQTSSFLQSVCAQHPKAIPKCEAFTRIYGSRLLGLLGYQMDAPLACEVRPESRPVRFLKEAGSTGTESLCLGNWVLVRLTCWLTNRTKDFCEV